MASPLSRTKVVQFGRTNLRTHPEYVVSTAEKLAQLLSNPLINRSTGGLKVLLQRLPTLLKYVLGLLLLINIRSWPFIWHVKVFVPVIEIRTRYALHHLSTLFMSKKAKWESKDKFLSGLCPIGEDPIKFTTYATSWAGPDDCDFNLHLSNSSYPKHLDWARFRMALGTCPTFFRAGGWIGLAASHFKFIREIPMFTTFEMRTTIAAWDNKWMFVVTRYVSRKRKSGKSKSRSSSITNGSAKPEEPTPSGDNAPFPSLHTPAHFSDITSTSSSGSTTPLSPLTGSANPAERIARLMPAEEPDGATVHCIAVSELCYKIGRITVPPGLILACEGFAAPSADPSVKTYTQKNPPPHYLKAHAMQRDDIPKGHLNTFQKFLTSGWRDVPEGERWWEGALGPQVEEMRRRNWDAMHGIMDGMNGAMVSMV
ncbi:hypothetical protein BDW22DRAFT_1348350 [Trametopsis cervina]|nr:hypothetical protein BDW22DRAFT_1348350 [Trametopsis cervina]